MEWYFTLLLILTGVLFLLIIIIIAFGFIMHKIVYGRSLITRDFLNNFIETSYVKIYKDIIFSGVDWFNELEKEEVYIQSSDKLKLKGYFIKGKENANKIMIMVHGYHSCPCFDFSGALRDYYSLGYSFLLIEQRAHEGSEGKYSTFGIKESDDLFNWIKYVDEKYNNDCEIVLSGISMGGATIMYTLGRDLPSTVKCAICDCGFTSPIAVVQHTIKTVYHMPPHILSWSLSFASFVRTGKFLGSLNTKDTLSKSKVPILIIHGDNDKTVPIEMSKKNFEYAQCEKELLIIPGADHGLSYLVDKKTYQEKVYTFINKYISNK